MYTQRTHKGNASEKWLASIIILNVKFKYSLGATFGFIDFDNLLKVFCYYKWQYSIYNYSCLLSIIIYRVRQFFCPTSLSNLFFQSTHQSRNGLINIANCQFKSYLWCLSLGPQHLKHLYFYRNSLSASVRFCVPGDFYSLSIVQPLFSLQSAVIFQVYSMSAQSGWFSPPQFGNESFDDFAIKVAKSTN
jgi:hypothetical protein